ncbi:MAG: hypothetical protein JSW60_04580 [Thermoplasmatales archaeon]|nr:MAG: hypothetical protein JSW60_04580 [Thermoplasmatales archaeon]
MKNRLLGIFVCMQTGGGSPTKKWVRVSSYVYFIQDKVTLIYVDADGIGIRVLHKVRCVDNTSGETKFPADCESAVCKFSNGQGTVIEGWVTKGPVEAGEWRWEVELLYGE